MARRRLRCAAFASHPPSLSIRVAFVAGSLWLAGLPAGPTAARAATRASAGLSGETVLVLRVDPATPTTLYAGTQTGLFKSLDSGKSWQLSSVRPEGCGFFAPCAFTDIAIDPRSTRTLYVATRGVFRTADGGESWQAMNEGGFPMRCSGVFEDNTCLPAFATALAIDPTDTRTLYVDTEFGLYKTTDGGGHWTRASAGMFGGETINSLIVDPMRPETIHAGAGGGIWRSTDGGIAWEGRIITCVPDSDTVSGCAPASVYALALDPRTSLTVYAATVGVFKSQDGGQTWGPSSAGLLEPATGRAAGITSLSVDPQDPGTLYAGSASGRVYRSLSEGASWNEYGPPLARATVITLLVPPIAPVKIFAGTDDGVLVLERGCDADSCLERTSCVVGTPLDAADCQPRFVKRMDRSVARASALIGKRQRRPRRMARAARRLKAVQRSVERASTRGRVTVGCAEQIMVKLTERISLLDRVAAERCGP